MYNEARVDFALMYNFFTACIEDILWINNGTGSANYSKAGAFLVTYYFFSQVAYSSIL